MAKFKKCKCGKIYYEDENNEFPDICTNVNCQMLLIDFDCIEEDENKNNQIPIQNQKEEFYLINHNLQIIIPIKKDVIIGRGINCVGHEQLKFNSVSREHLKVKIINKYMLEVEDISKFGTKINGKAMMKGVPQKVTIGDTISLYEYDLRLERKSM